MMIVNRLENYLTRISDFKENLLFPFVERFWPRWFLPNHLTVARLAIGIALFYFLFYHTNQSKELILLLFAAGALTDLFDGVVARCLKKETNFGAIMDPVADRFLIIPVAISSLFNYHLSLLFFLLAAELINLGVVMFAKRRKLLLNSSMFAKSKMVLQSIGFIGILFYWPASPHPFFIGLFWLSLVCFIITLYFVLKDITLSYVNKNI